MFTHGFEDITPSQEADRGERLVKVLADGTSLISVGQGCYLIKSKDGTTTRGIDNKYDDKEVFEAIQADRK